MLHARPDYDRIQDPSGKIPKDEPVFIIRGQDHVGAEAVRGWADLAREAGASNDITELARDQADRMEKWAAEHGKVPDLPSAKDPAPEGWQEVPEAERRFALRKSDGLRVDMRHLHAGDEHWLYESDGTPAHNGALFLAKSEPYMAGEGSEGKGWVVQSDEVPGTAESAPECTSRADEQAAWDAEAALAGGPDSRPDDGDFPIVVDIYCLVLKTDWMKTDDWGAKATETCIALKDALDAGSEQEDALNQAKAYLEDFIETDGGGDLAAAERLLGIVNAALGV